MELFGKGALVVIERSKELPLLSFGIDLLSLGYCFCSGAAALAAIKESQPSAGAWGEVSARRGWPGGLAEGR